MPSQALIIKFPVFIIEHVLSGGDILRGFICIRNGKVKMKSLKVWKYEVKQCVFLIQCNLFLFFLPWPQTLTAYPLAMGQALGKLVCHVWKWDKLVS